MDIGNAHCYLSILLGRAGEGYLKLSLGIPFFGAAYLVFHPKRREVWFGQADDCSTDIRASGSDGSVPIVEGCHCDASDRKKAGNGTRTSFTC